MDKTFLEERPAQTERHIAKGEALINRQRQIVSELERDGHDTRPARALLTQFLESQAMQSRTATG
jgi:hypothetical protein